MATPSKSRPWNSFLLRNLVEEVAKSLESRCKDHAIATTIDIPSDLAVTADRAMIRRAVEHLMLGAIAAMPHGGSLVATSAAGPQTVELEIADTGSALSDEARRHAFDPSGTTERGASGWELAMVRRIAETHGGSVTAANCPDGGAAYTLRIPRRAALEAAA
jgi:signal transduction histidine kinase